MTVTGTVARDDGLRALDEQLRAAGFVHGGLRARQDSTLGMVVEAVVWTIGAPVGSVDVHADVPLPDSGEVEVVRREGTRPAATVEVPAGDAAAVGALLSGRDVGDGEWERFACHPNRHVRAAVAAAAGAPETVRAVAALGL